MEKTEILAICTNEPILQTVIRLINNNEAWNCTGAIDKKLAMDMIGSKQFDLILLGAGLTDEEEKELMAYVKTMNVAVPVVRHYGGGSGLLSCEIFQALESKG